MPVAYTAIRNNSGIPSGIAVDYDESVGRLCEWRRTDSLRECAVKN